MNQKKAHKKPLKYSQKDQILTTPSSTMKDETLDHEIAISQELLRAQEETRHIKKQIKTPLKDPNLFHQEDNNSKQPQNTDTSSFNQGNILPGGFDAPKSSGAYNQRSHAPGAISQTPAIDEHKGGGKMATNEVERSKTLAKQRQQKQTQSMLTGQFNKPNQKPTQQQQQQQQTTTRSKSSTGNQMVDRAMQLKTVQQSKIFQAAQKAKAIKEEIKKAKEMVKKAKKAAKLIDNLIKAGEIIGSETLLPLVTLAIQEYLEVINKYTFKSELLPETFFIEDIFVVYLTVVIMFDILIPIFIIVLFFAITYVAITHATGPLKEALSIIDQISNFF